ncbi:hypothetical protein BDF14DRAFT_1792741 [Spinellus fusiger]|nr:hypothetical protein BDF14DRAFT_1792741 [Spinellus fusiger]
MQSRQAQNPQRSDAQISQTHSTRPAHRRRNRENGSRCSELEKQIKALTLQISKMSSGKD